MSKPKQTIKAIGDNSVLENWEIAQELVNFFSELSPQELAQENQSLKLFINLLHETEYMNDVALRKEAMRLQSRMDNLQVIASKYDQKQLQDNLEFLAYGHATTYLIEKENKEVASV